MMKNVIIKKFLAAGCVAALLLTAPGLSVLAEELKAEEAFSDAGESKEAESISKFSAEDVVSETDTASDLSVTFYESVDEDAAWEDLNETSQEEVVGADHYTFGDGLEYTFDRDTGALELYSDGGTLPENWKTFPDTDISIDDVKSVKAVSGTVYLPTYSSSMFGDCRSLTNLDLRSFNTSNVTDIRSMFFGCSSLTYLDLSSFDTSNVLLMTGMFTGCSDLQILKTPANNAISAQLDATIPIGALSAEKRNLTMYRSCCKLD